MDAGLTKNSDRARGLFPFLLLVLAALGFHAFRYWPFLSDDALVSLRYSRRLLQGLGLTWDSYDPVQGYASLLWVLASAGLGLSGIDLVAASRILGGLGMAATVLACLAAARCFRWPGVLPFLASGFPLALSGSMAVWLIGGPEQAFIAAFLAWSVLLVQRANEEHESRRGLLLGAGALLSLQVLTRPDAMVLVAALAAALWCAAGFSREGLRSAIRLVALPLAAFAGQMALRIAYYGDWLPNAAYLTPAPSWARVQSGLAYVGQGLLYLAPLLLSLALGLHPRVRAHLATRRLAVPLFVLVAWCGYLVLIGGDSFPARRQLVPVVVLLALMQGELVAAVLRAGGRLRSWAWPVFGVALLVLGLGQYQDPENRGIIGESWQRKGRTIGLFYKRAFGEQQPLLATTAAGCLPFWSELPAVDLLGLNDRQIARSRPPGDGEYVLSREPDLVIEELGTDQSDPLRSPSARQMVADPRWMQHYVIVRFVAREPEELAFHTFVRSTSERIGIRRTASAVVIPGFLYAAGWESVAGLDPDGILALALSETAPAGNLRVDLDAGRWRVEFETRGNRSSAVRLALQAPGVAQRTLSAGSILELPESGAAMTTIATRARDPIYVRSVSFHRLADSGTDP